MILKRKVILLSLLIIYVGVRGVLGFITLPSPTPSPTPSPFTAGGTTVCPTSYLYSSNGYCYGLLSNALSFLDASFACFQTRHGVLAGLSSAAEENIITQLFTQQNIVCSIGSPCDIWLGWTNYHYTDHEGEFYRMDFKSDLSFMESTVPITAIHNSSDHALLASYNGTFSYELVSMAVSAGAWPLCSLPAANNTGPNGCTVSADWMRLTPSTMYYFDATARTAAESKCFCNNKGGHPISLSSLAEVVYLSHISSLYNTNGIKIFLGMEKVGTCSYLGYGAVRGYGESFSFRNDTLDCNAAQCYSEPCFRGSPRGYPDAIFRWMDADCDWTANNLYITVCESFPNICPADIPPSGTATNVSDALEFPCTAYQGNAMPTTSPATVQRHIVCPPDFTTTAPEVTTITATTKHTTAPVTNQAPTTTAPEITTITATTKASVTNHAGGTTVCPTSYLYNSNGYCYGLLNATLSFLDASFACFRTQHGVLAGLSSAAEEFFIKQMFAQQNIVCNPSCDIWLGWTNYHHSDHDGEYYWMDFKSDSSFIKSRVNATATQNSSDHASVASYNGTFSYELVSISVTTAAWHLCSLPAANNTGPSGCSAPADWRRLTPSTMYYYDPAVKTAAESKCFCNKKGGHPISFSSLAEVVYLRHISTLYNVNNIRIFLGMEKTSNYSCSPPKYGLVRGYGESFSLRKDSLSCNEATCDGESCFRGNLHASAVIRWSDFDCEGTNAYATVCESFPNICPADIPPSATATNVTDVLELPCTAYQADAVMTTSATTAPRYVVCPPDFNTTATPEVTTITATTKDTTAPVTNQDPTTTAPEITTITATTKHTTASVTNLGTDLTTTALKIATITPTAKGTTAVLLQGTTTSHALTTTAPEITTITATTKDATAFVTNHDFTTTAPEVTTITATTKDTTAPVTNRDPTTTAPEITTITATTKDTTGSVTNHDSTTGTAQTQTTITTVKQGAPNNDEMLEIPANNSKFPMVAGVVAIALMVTFLACCVAADAPALFASLKYAAKNVCSFFGRCCDKRKKRKSQRVASNARVSPAVSSN